MADFLWTEERVERLRQLFDDRHTAAEIAAKFGEGLSRNAVCGKLSRLGLTRGPDKMVIVAKKPRVPKHEQVGAPTGSLAFKVINGIKQQKKRAENPGIDPVPFVCGSADVEPKNLTLLELTESTCRYPSADAPFTFCGHQIRSGSPYCGPHHLLCFVPPPQRRSVTPITFGRSRGGVFGRVA